MRRVQNFLEHAKLLYTNDTQCLYGLCQNLFNVIVPKRLVSTITKYLSKIHALLHDFNELSPHAFTCSTLLRVPNKYTIDIPTNPVYDSYALVSQRDDPTHLCKSGKGRHKCDHCGNLGHKIDRYYSLHGRPSKPTTLSQIAPLV